MTEIMKKVVSGNGYKNGLIGFDRFFSMVNPNFDWRRGDKILVDYNEDTDTVTARRVK